MNWGEFILNLMDDNLDVSDLPGEFEKRLADFDFEKDGADLLYSFLQPQLEATWDALRANDEKTKQICRDAGLSDVEIEWQKYERGRYTLRQKRRLMKLQEDTITLIDAELTLWSIRDIVLKHRLDLEEEMGELLLFEK